MFFGILFTVLSYYIFPPFNQRIMESYNNINQIIQPLSLEQKIEIDANYLYNNNKTFSKEYYYHKIISDSTWVAHIDNKYPEYETSIGKRYIYIKNSIQLIKNKPLFGAGAHQFKQLYAANFHEPDTAHPHNNFLFILVELGIVGFFIFITIFISQIQYFTSPYNLSFMQLILPLLFIVIMFVDNYFLNHNTLALWCVFTFIFLEKNDPKTIDKSALFYSIR